MNKRITTAPGQRRPSRRPIDAGLEVGAFFILCYPGETDDTVLDTLRFATLAAARLPGADDALPAARHGARRRGSAAGARASGARTAACCSNHALTFDGRRLGDQDALRAPQGPRAVRDAPPARAALAPLALQAVREGRPTRSSGCVRCALRSARGRAPAPLPPRRPPWSRRCGVAARPSSISER